MLDANLRWVVSSSPISIYIYGGAVEFSDVGDRPLAAPLPVRSHEAVAEAVVALLPGLAEFYWLERCRSGTSTSSGPGNGPTSPTSR